LSKSRPAVVLLGPQRIDPVVRGATAAPDIGVVLAELGVRHRVALITAGWQEREADDEPLVKTMGVPADNLRLHTRSQDVFTDDPALTAAYSARQELLRHLQSFYRIRLDKTDDAARAIQVRHVEPELLAQEWRVSVEQFRQLDLDHLERCRAIHAAFQDRWQLATRPAIARHRDELRALLSTAEALVIAGGHVASLLNRMQLFDVLALAAGLPIVAWSAGAMVLTDRIVLFHDFPPYGSDIAQVLDAGFGVVPGVVALPDAARRVRQDDRAGIARFAQRMAPATCVAMDPGARLAIVGGRLTSSHAARLTADGDIDRSWHR
jgi:hypothetical protein